MSINCWLSKTKHDNPFAGNLLSSEMIAINQGYRYFIGKYLGDLRKLNHVIVLKAGFEPQL